jgi:hypothetical protein
MRRSIWLLAAAWGGAVMAAPVKELKPEELAAFVAQHEYVVVQMTSPDSRCGYCKGADKLFDQAAALPHKPALAFARVQWTPWRQMPDFGKLIHVGWIPQQPVFFKGKLLGSVDGKPEDPKTLLSKIDSVIADPPVAHQAREAPPPPPTAPAVPLSDAERGAVRLGIRRDFLSAVSAACGKRFPQHAASYQQAVDGWRSANEAALKQSTLLMISRTSREDAKAMGPLVEQEKKTLQAWQTGKLGISMQTAPAIGDCDKLFAGLGSLP